MSTFREQGEGLQGVVGFVLDYGKMREISTTFEAQPVTFESSLEIQLLLTLLGVAYGPHLWYWTSRGVTEKVTDETRFTLDVMYTLVAGVEQKLLEALIPVP